MNRFPLIWATLGLLIAIAAAAVVLERPFRGPPAPEPSPPPPVATPEPAPAPAVEPAPAAPPAPPPDMVEVAVDGGTRAVSVAALRAFGATPLEVICARARAPDAELWRVMACAGRPGDDTLSSAAALRLQELDGASGAERSDLAGGERDEIFREVNGLALAAMALSERRRTDAWSDLRFDYEVAAGRTAEARLYEAASELALFDAAVCDPAGQPSCAADAIKGAAIALGKAGARLNDIARLKRSVPLYEEALATLPREAGPEEEPLIRDGLAGAYHYASQLAAMPEARELIDAAIREGEKTLAYADTRARPELSARFWSNLAASYASRAAYRVEQDDFRRAVELYDLSLTLVTRARNRETWAVASQNAADARSALARLNRDLPLHDGAVAQLRAALAAQIDGEDPAAVAWARFTLARALTARAGTAATQMSDPQASRETRDRLGSVARDSLAEADAVAGEAEAAFRRLGSGAYLKLVETLRGDIGRRRGALPAPEAKR